MTNADRSRFLNSLMEDVHALINAAMEAGDEETAEIFAEFGEWICNDHNEVTWMDSLTLS